VGNLVVRLLDSAPGIRIWLLAEKNGRPISGRQRSLAGFGFPSRGPVRHIHIGLEELSEAALSEAVKTAVAEVGA
jgi:hypothetical protein